MRTGARGWLALLLAAVCASAAQAVRRDEIHFSGGQRPAVLDALELPDSLQALAFSPDGRRAAVASAAPGRKKRSLLSLHQLGSEPREVDVSGTVRGLFFGPDGDRLFALVHKEAKRLPGESQLAALDWDKTKLRRVRRVPPSATSIDYWLARHSLLIASQNEIRTVRLDGMRSGPLFRIPGRNLAVTSLAGSDLVLVGQKDDLLLIDLADPPGPDAMPVRDRTPVSAPVVALASSPDGRSALARLEDGRVLAVAFNPLRVAERGTGAAVLSLSRERVREPIEPPPLDRPRAESPKPAETPTPAGPPTPTEPRPPGAPAEPAPARPGAAPSQGTREPAGPPGAAQPGPAPARPPETPTEGGPQVRGRIVGAAASEVTDVVLLGPSNILREAARVRPAADGSWQVRGLEPGRYRVQLDPGGRRVLVSEPVFLVVDVGETGTVDAPEFRVLRAYTP